MSRQAESLWLGNRRNIVVVLRLIVFSIIYLIILQERGLKDMPPAFWAATGAFLLSEIACLFEYKTYFFIQRILGWIFVLDAVLISVLIYLLGIKSSQLFIGYFAVIAIAAISKNVKASFVITFLVSAFYLFASIHTGNFAWLEFLTRMLFFFGVAIFASYLAQEVDTQQSQKKKTEEMLDKSQERHRYLMNNPLVGVYQSTLKGEFLYVNQALADMLGYDSAEELKRVKIITLYRDAETRAGFISKLKEAGRVNSFEVELLTKTGQTRNILISGTLDGEIISGVNMDITERKQAEEALQQSEKKYRNLVDNALAGVYVTNVKGDLLYANETIMKIFEFDSIAEMLSGGAVVRYKNPKDRETLLDNLKKTGRVTNFEFEGITKKGNTRNILASAALSGEILTGMIIDITERKQAEEALKMQAALLDNSIDSIFLIDEKGRFIYANKSAYQTRGYTKEEFMNLTLAELDTPEYGKLIQSRMRQVREKGRARFEAAHRCKDGSIMPVEINTSAVELGGRQYFLAVMRDITERKKAEAEKEQLHIQLLQAQKMETVGTLSGGIAHDFNNILAAVRGYAELSLMDMDKSNPLYEPSPWAQELGENLKHVMAASDRGRNLTNQLLLFSRKQSMNHKVCDLNELINNLLTMLNRLIGENFNIETDLGRNLYRIKADLGNLEQVIMNLALNARDAMPKGGKITIQTENIALDEKYCKLNIESRCGNFVMLTVVDTGTGMTNEVLSHIFEPFFTTKEQGKGTGLGLSVVYGIIKQHQGWINVYSEPDKGAVFKIYLPASDEAAQTKPETRIVSPDDFKGRQERILVLEDEDAMLKLIISVLTKMNYTVFPAANLAQARQVFEQEKGDFRMILSDMTLPDGNGLDLCDELTAKNKNIKVLLSSGYPSREENRDIIRERGWPFIAKPYNLALLFKMMREVLESKP